MLRTYVIQDLHNAKFFYRESPSHHGVWMDSPFDANHFASADAADHFAHRVLCLNPANYAIVSV